MSSTELRLTTYVHAERLRIIDTLFEWLRIPSISAHHERSGDVLASAHFTADMLREAGFEHVTVLATAGGPAVYGDWLHAGPEAPTALVYGHHDVQPVDPLDQWMSPPFEPVIVGDDCLARGAVDDKGQVLYEIEAARGLLRTEGKLPINLKFLIEGEEEVGSPHFEALLTEHLDLLACDVAVVSDTGMLGPDLPSVCTGMRGLVAFDLTVRTAATDLHSGMYGGAVLNPAHLVAQLVAELHDHSGRVSLPGFYDAVRPLTEAERASLAAIPFDPEAWRHEARAAALHGEDGYSTLERIGYRPTAEVVGFNAGYAGDGIKTIVPATANLKVTFRLVPDQDPTVIADGFGHWVAKRLPAGAEAVLTAVGAVAPALTPVDHPAMGALVRAIERVWGEPPLFTREGGSGPEEALGRVLNAPVLFLGIGLPGDRIHAPNERMVMDQFWRGLLAAGELWHELAASLG